MKNLSIGALGFTLVLTFLNIDVSAKSWQGLIPTKSTRSDTARLAQECGSPDPRCVFAFEGSEVMIIFSGSNVGYTKCPKLPEGTVLAIRIKFTRPRPLENFRLKNQKEILFDPSSPPDHGYKGYYYPKEGFIISSFEGRVVEVVYVAKQKDIPRCPEYYDDPKAFVQVGLYPKA